MRLIWYMFVGSFMAMLCMAVWAAVCLAISVPLTLESIAGYYLGTMGGLVGIMIAIGADGPDDAE